MPEMVDEEIKGTLKGKGYEAVRAAYDWEKQLREWLGKDIKDMSFTEYVIALAVVTSASRTK